MPSISTCSAPRMAFAVARPPDRCTSGSFDAVNDGDRHVDVGQPLRAVGLGEHREHVPSGAARAPAAVVRLVGAGQGCLARGRVGGGGERLGRTDGLLGVGVASAAGGAEQQRDELRVEPADGAASRRGHDRRQRQHAVAVVDRQGLADHAAHRHADDVDAVETEVVEQPDGVDGEVVDRVRRPAAAERGADDVALGDPVLAQLRRATGIPVVVPDDEETTIGQHLAERRIPPVHGAAETHDQQDRRVVGLAERLVAEVDARGQRGELLSGSAHVS